MDYAKITADFQNNGRMDLFISSAIKLAKECGVIICDCYSKWKELNKTQDTTKLLANYINHPVKEMHQLFADSLFDVLFKYDIRVSKEVSDSMFDFKNQNMD